MDANGPTCSSCAAQECERRSEMEAPEKGLKEKAKKFTREGSEDYAKA